MRTRNHDYNSPKAATGKAAFDSVQQSDWTATATAPSQQGSRTAAMSGPRGNHYGTVTHDDDSLFVSDDEDDDHEAMKSSMTTPSHVFPEHFHYDIPNIVVPEGELSHVYGTHLACNQLGIFVSQGFVLQRATSTGFVGILEAVCSTLNAVHTVDEHSALTVADLKKTLQSKAFQKHAKTAPVGYSSLVVNNPHISYVLGLLDYLGEKRGEEYSLGHIYLDPRNHHWHSEIIGHPSGSGGSNHIWISNLHLVGSDSWDQWAGFMRHLPALEGETSSSTAILATTNNEFESRNQDEKSSSHQVQGIVTAPPRDTDLPWHAMAGITAGELVNFLPNHARFWPAICARIVEDGWTATEVTSHIREVWESANSSVTAGSANAVDRTTLSNTVTASINKGLGQFYGNKYYTFFHWKDALRERETASKAVLSNLRQRFETTKWQLPTSNRYRTPVLQPAWSLVELGQAVINAHGSIPCDGLFTHRVMAALQNCETPYDNSGSNPPALPLGWKIRMPDEKFDIVAMAIGRKCPDVQGANERLKIVQDSSSMHVPKKAGNRLRREDMDCSIRDDPVAIMKFHPQAIEGETLLFIRSQGWTVKEIADELEKVFDAAMQSDPSSFSTGKRNKALDRSTFSKRQKQALEARATRNGTTYIIENQDLEEAYKAAVGIPEGVGNGRNRKKGSRIDHTIADTGAAQNLTGSYYNEHPKVLPHFASEDHSWLDAYSNTVQDMNVDLPEVDPEMAAALQRDIENHQRQAYEQQSREQFLDMPAFTNVYAQNGGIDANIDPALSNSNYPDPTTLNTSSQILSNLNNGQGPYYNQDTRSSASEWYGNRDHDFAPGYHDGSNTNNASSYHTSTSSPDSRADLQNDDFQQTQRGPKKSSTLDQDHSSDFEDLFEDDPNDLDYTQSNDNDLDTDMGNA